MWFEKFPYNFGQENNDSEIYRKNSEKPDRKKDDD